MNINMLYNFSDRGVLPNIQPTDKNMNNTDES